MAEQAAEQAVPQEAQSLISILRDMVAAKTSLIYLLSDEDRRIETEIKTLASSIFRNPPNVYIWSCTTGVTLNDEQVVSSPAIMDALDWFMEIQETAFLILNDIHVFLNENPPVIRRLKDLARRIDNNYKTVFMVSPLMSIPPEIDNDIVLVDVPLPGAEEIERILAQVVAREKHKDALNKSLTQDVKDLFVKAGAGLTSQQVQHAFRKSVSGRQAITSHEIDLLYEEKKQIVRKSGLLELVTHDINFDDLGGFSTLKKWLQMRKDIFSKRARDFGLDLPKGVLMMGISGCGKSLCIKAISAFWEVPLLRLDMGKLYDGILGSPEECLRKVIKTSEATAPCILWIDEIEAGIANAAQKSLGGSASRVLAGFLTWMQEKTSQVFIGATANQIELLPPEMLRKGRFDELFYVELPSDQEREEIIRIHLSRKNIPLNLFEYPPLVKITNGFNGAEIEVGVASALFRAYSANRDVKQEDLYICLESIVPLSTTMQEQIKTLERWAHNRALKAGGN
jgi:SpoVK/Ycf46/Vps4 family AAA+-type ATPase